MRNNEGTRTGNRQDFIKLVFPISDQLFRNGIRRNTSDTDHYERRNVSQPFRVQGIEFDETGPLLRKTIRPFLHKINVLIGMPGRLG
ncbi:hypothetical protein [Spirosoma endophyticum]|uniref:hypothetical protein n=1 Tax=Spirosoma endophyticum TaxID=662367 RepID=UPI000B81C603|nr:hypothetical protein [Spirosoma endophyticum]